MELSFDGEQQNSGRAETISNVWFIPLESLLLDSIIVPNISSEGKFSMAGVETE